MKTRFLRDRGRWFIVFAIALAVVILHTPATSAQAPPVEPTASTLPTATPGSRVTGVGTTTLGEHFPAEFRGDRTLVMVTAQTLPDHSVRGIFAITHRQPNGELFADLRGEIMCVAVGGEDAVLLGRITVARTPGLPGGDVHEGMVAAIVVRDGGDSDHMAWTFGNPEMVPDCAELPVVAPNTVEQGNFVVRE